MRKRLSRASIVGVNLQIPLPQLQGNRFHQLQIPLAGQALVGNRQRRVKARGLLAQQSPLENAFEIANAQLGTAARFRKTSTSRASNAASTSA